VTDLDRPARGIRLSTGLSVALLGCALTACAATTAPDGTAAAPVRVAATRTGAGLPAVTGATDLTAKPTVAPGAGVPSDDLLTRDLVVGAGAAASAQSTVSVRYVGALWADGAEFDSSWSRGQPAVFPLSQVIPGFRQGITGMKIGGRREIVIPPAFGFGATPQKTIPGGSTLVFVVDLVGLPMAGR
jgi:peptidylprolyl isomerase